MRRANGHTIVTPRSASSTPRSTRRARRTGSWSTWRPIGSRSIRKCGASDVEEGCARSSYENDAENETPRETAMKYAFLIYESPEAFARRKDYRGNEPMLSAWRAYHRSLVDAGVYVAGDPLHVPE